jgi:hypothetical protein
MWANTIANTERPPDNSDLIDPLKGLMGLSLLLQRCPYRLSFHFCTSWYAILIHSDVKCSWMWSWAIWNVISYM